MLRQESSGGGKWIVVAAAVLANLPAVSAPAGPADVGGLVLWLDTDAKHVTKNADNRVSAWFDITDPSNNTTPDNTAQSDPARRPLWTEKAIGGRPALEFDSGDFLNHKAGNLVAAGSARTVFVVGRLDNRSRGASVLAFRRSSSAANPLFGVNLYAAGDPPTMFLVYTDGSNGNRNTPIFEPSVALEAIRRPFISTHRSAGSGQTIAVELNGMPLGISSDAAVSSEGGLDGFTVGGSENYPENGWHGLIAEILVYDRDLKADERKQVGLYMAKRYGISNYGVAILPRLHVAASEARRPDALAAAVTLESDLIGAKFDSETGSLIQLTNKLTDQTLNVWGDQFRIETSRFTFAQQDASQVTLVKKSDEQFQATYEADGHRVVATWQLGAGRHFLRKQLVFSSSAPFGFRNLVISNPGFSGVPLEFAPYRHLKSVTYFGRCRQGGIFLGVELAFDHSCLDARNMVSLGYAPKLKVEADQEIVCEPAYFGVYRKLEEEEEKEEKGGLPLASESEAMVAMTSAILPPNHRRLGPLMCGWWSETFRQPYRTPEDARHDMRSIDFCKECGIDVISDGRTWSGDTLKVNALEGEQEFQLSELALKVAHYARQQGVRWVFWPTMGHSDPWSNRGRQLRLDKPEWTMIHEGADRANSKPAACFACKPFHDWLTTINLEAMDAGRYGAWCMDGDFAGGAGWGGGPSGSVHPARCHSKLHDHISPDVDYSCQRNLTQMADLMRRRYPDVYLFYCRPPMDLGVWALRHVDASFTVNEWARLEGLPGIEGQPVNVLLGDKIRHWSRIRVHHHFFPHYLDSPQVFAAPKSMTSFEGVDWRSDHIDYIMLSALSSSPNQTFYLPSQAGIPAEDKREIRKWLDWGRENIDYIMVRKDLSDWPAAGKVDGSAHVLEDRGYVFLFNPNPEAVDGTFSLDESIGMVKGERFHVSSVHPTSETRTNLARGRKVIWSIPGQTAVVLEITPE